MGMETEAGTARESLFAVLGDRRYRIDRPWGRWPAHIPVGTISKCAVDAGGALYVCQRRATPVLVFDPEGNFVRSWGDGVLADPHGITVAPDGRVLVVDRDAHQVLAFDAGGKLLFALGERHRPRTQAPFNHPTDVAVGPEGDLYVSDGYGNTMVHKFAPDGALLRSWGGRGSGPGAFATPHGIAVLRDGRVLVGDRENDRVQVFSPDGDYLAAFGPFHKPMDIYVDAGERIHVTDQVPRVTALSADGTILGSCKPAPVMPHGVSGAADGTLYFVETHTTAITRFAPAP